MTSPFPGMDPYLEDPELWSGFHASFIAELQTQLSPRVRPDYFVRIEERVYVADEDDPGYRRLFRDARVVQARVVQARRPGESARFGTSDLMIAEPIPVVDYFEEEIHEHRLEIRDSVDRAVVTVIELLSPANKTPGSKGRSSFLQKRRETFASPAHWMEIDLLRAGVSTSNHSPVAGTAYHVYLSRGGDPRKPVIWPMPLHERLPVVGVPLKHPHADVPLELQLVFDQVYSRGGYDLDLEMDYKGDPTPPYSPAELQWIRGKARQSTI